MKKLFLFAVILSIWTASAAVAAEHNGLAVARQMGQRLEGGKLYAVTYTCTGRATFAKNDNSISDIFAGLLPFADTTKTFGFFLFKGSPKSTPNGSFSGDGAVGVQHVYTADRKQSSSSFDNTHCQGQYIVNGKDALNVLAFLSTSKVAQTKILAGTAAFVSSSIGPLLSLVSGIGALQSINQAALKDGNTIVNNYATFLSAFDNTKDFSVVFPLKTGHVTIGTDLATVDMDTIYVDTLLTAKNVPFRDSLDAILNKQIDLTSQLGDPAKLRAKCTSLAAEWIKAGLSSPLDQAFVLVSAIEPSSPNKNQVLTCLGKERALAAIPHLSLFRMPRELLFSIDDVNWMTGDPTISPGYGQQPQGWSNLSSTANALIIDLNRLGRGITLPKAEKDRFAAMFAPTMKIEDETFDFYVKAKIAPLSDDSIFAGNSMTMVGQLISGGFLRWGCFVETDADITLKSGKNEALVLLAWMDSPNGLRPSVVRVFFDERRQISGLVLDDNNPAAIVKKSGCTPPDTKQSEAKS